MHHFNKPLLAFFFKAHLIQIPHIYMRASLHLPIDQLAPCRVSIHTWSVLYAKVILA